MKAYTLGLHTYLLTYYPRVPGLFFSILFWYYLRSKMETSYQTSLRQRPVQLERYALTATHTFLFSICSPFYGRNEILLVEYDLMLHVLKSPFFCLLNFPPFSDMTAQFKIVFFLCYLLVPTLNIGNYNTCLIIYS